MRVCCNDHEAMLTTRLGNAPSVKDESVSPLSKIEDEATPSAPSAGRSIPNGDHDHQQDPSSEHAVNHEDERDNRELTREESELLITTTSLATLTSGPITMACRRPMRNSHTSAGGRE